MELLQPPDRRLIDAPRPGSGTRRRRTRDGDHAPAPKPGLVHHSDQGSQGGFNWSSQRSRLEGCDGKACGVDARVEGSGGDEVAGGTVATSGCRAVVLA